MSEELKPCPFCENYISPKLTLRGCSNIECFMYENDGVSFAQWNTRPIEDKLRAENERLKFIVKIRSEALNEFQDKLEKAKGANRAAKEWFETILSSKQVTDISLTMAQQGLQDMEEALGEPLYNYFYPNNGKCREYLKELGE